MSSTHCTRSLRLCWEGFGFHAAPKRIRCSLCRMRLSMGRSVIADLPCKLTPQVLLLSCVFFFFYHICVGWFCFTLFIFVLQEFLLFNLSGKHSWSVLLKCSLNAFRTCQCIQCTMNLGLHRTVKEICVCDAPWCIELILNSTHNSHSVLFPYLLGDICILSDFIKSATQHALVSHQSVAGMNDYTCTSGRWENKGAWSLVHRTD